MRLTAYTDYTLRTLIYLALAPDRLVRIADIARSYGISEAHLMKVVHRLGVAGIVETVRGRNGGLRLAVAPRDINLGATVRQAEADLALAPCADPGAPCAIRSACRLRGVLDEALDAFFAVLDRYTLADLAAPRNRLVRLLDLPAPTTVSRAAP